MKDIVLSLPFLTGFLFAFGGGDPVGPIRKPKIFRRLGIGLSIALFSTINQGFHIPQTILIVLLYWGATSLGYGKAIEGENWHIVFFVGMCYGLAGLPLYDILKIPGFIVWPMLICGTGFVLLCMTSSILQKLPWKWAEGIMGFLLGLFPALAMAGEIKIGW